MGEILILIGAGLAIFWAFSKYVDAKRTTKVQPVTFYAEYDDPIEQPDWSVEESLSHYCPRPITATIKLDYVDSQGRISQRIVDARECDTSAPDGYLVGFCHLRRSVRTFRLDRIQSAVDMGTGEVISSLREFAEDKYQNSPIAAMDALYKSHADALRVLLYIGKADGRFTAKEKQFFLDFCLTVQPGGKIDMETINDLFKYIDPPTMYNYKVLCGYLAKQDEVIKSAILSAAEGMIVTQKTVAPEETAAIDYMKKRFASGK